MSDIKFADLTREQRNALVSASTSFQMVLKDVFGADWGEEIWQNIADNVLPDLKLQMLKNLFTQEYGDTVTIVSAPPRQYDHNGNAIGRTYQKVQAIKAIRNATGFGLKHAKDVCDAAEGGIPTVLKMTLGYYYEWDASGNRVVVNKDMMTTRRDLMEELRAAGVTAI